MIPPRLHEFIQIDLPQMLTAVLAALTCGLLGNFLVLRRQSLMGDAIAHAVLPGLVLAFLLTETRATWTMFVGAAIAGILTAILIELVRVFGRVEPGAAMGVVFSVFFALGVLLLEQAAARTVDLDADCVLHGQLETIFWFPPTEWNRLLTLSELRQLPRELFTLAIVTTVVIVVISLLFKELRITSFDPALATSLGINAGAMHHLLMILVAAAAVASFTAVGSILVIAMLICPAATARLLTDRLTVQVWISGVIAVVTGVTGYILGAFAPLWIGLEHSVSAAGMMTVVAGFLLFGAIVFSPSHGIIAKRLRQLRLAVRVAREDILAMLFRVEESGATITTVQALAGLDSGWVARRALRKALRLAEVRQSGDKVELTENGRAAARSLIRTHRLWETYLVHELGLRPDHVHGTAMDLEHVTSPEMEARLGRNTPDVDPHDRPIPEA